MPLREQRPNQVRQRLGLLRIGNRDDDLMQFHPFAALAQTQQQLHDRLLELTPTPSPELQAAWQAAAHAIAAGADLMRPSVPMGPEQWLILITCRDEKHQVELLERLLAEGLECRALLS